MGLLPIKPAEVLFSYTGPDTLMADAISRGFMTCAIPLPSTVLSPGTERGLTCSAGCRTCPFIWATSAWPLPPFTYQ